MTLPISNLSVYVMNNLLRNNAPGQIPFSTFYNTAIPGVPIDSNQGSLAMGMFLGATIPAIQLALASGMPIVARECNPANNFSYCQLATDNNGNIYATGTYSSTSSETIPNLDGTPSLRTLPSTSGSTHGYVIRWTSNSCSLSGRMADGTTMPYSIGIDNSQNIHVVGQYTSTTSSLQMLNLGDGSTSSNTLPQNAATLSFYTTYDSNGQCLRSSLITVGGTVPWSIMVDPISGGTYVGGQYNSSSNLLIRNQDGTVSSNVILSTTGSDPFLIKYDSNGTCLQGQRILNGAGTDYIQGMAIDVRGRLYVTGVTSTGSPINLKNLDGTNSSFNIGASTGIDAFVAIYSSNGTCVGAANSVQGTNNDSGWCVASDNSNLYMGGHYQSQTNTVTLKNLPSNTNSSYVLPITPAANSSFVAKFNTGGTVVGGAQLFSAATSNVCTAIAAMTSGCFACGFYSNSNAQAVRNLSGTNSALTLPPSSNANAYIIQYNLAGNCVAAVAPIQSSGVSTVSSARIQGNRLYVSGRYSANSNVLVQQLNGSNTGIVLSATSNQNWPFCLTFPI